MWGGEGHLEALSRVLLYLLRAENGPGLQRNLQGVFPILFRFRNHPVRNRERGHVRYGYAFPWVSFFEFVLLWWHLGTLFILLLGGGDLFLFSVGAAFCRGSQRTIRNSCTRSTHLYATSGPQLRYVLRRLLQCCQDYGTYQG